MEKQKRNTKQKQAIVKYLMQNKNRHLTIEEIKTGISEEIGTTTIYRRINELVKEGQVFKIPLTNKQGYCYQYNQETKTCNNHYHLLCENCGNLIHFESTKFEDTKIEALQNENFTIDTEKVVLYGKCKECKRRQSK